MSKRAFLDLRERDLLVFLPSRNGKAGSSPEVLSVPVGEGYSFSLGSKRIDIDESFLSLPMSLLNFRIIELPFDDTGKIRELLPFEIDGLILGGSGSVVSDVVVLEKRNGNFRVLVACIPKEILRTVLARFKALGFDPSFVTCLELSHVLASAAPRGETAGLLVAPPLLTDEERMNAAMGEMERPTINLRRDEFACTVETDKTRKSLKVTAALTSLLLIIFFSDMAITIFSAKKENAAIRDDMRRTYMGLFPDEKKITSALYQMKAHMKEMEEKKGAFIGVSPLQTLLDLSRISRPGLAITEMTLDREIVILKGECPTLSDAQKFRNDLDGMFSDVVVSDTKPSAQNRTLFTITAKVKKA